MKLPIAHMTLYKHGIGYFRRRASFEGTSVELTFRADEMNDILKSLTVIDRGGGQVLAVDYATPRDREERLAGCTVRLEPGRSLRDLLGSLRGRRVRLLLDQNESEPGTLLGSDEMVKDRSLETSLVSLLREDARTVLTWPLGRVRGVELLDERGAADLRYFLQNATAQEEYRSVAVHLSPGEHALEASYIAPAPTWRVSYRAVIDEAPSGSAAFLQGWGIFDNRLDEDLEGISLTLVAGMPISFVYDLYRPVLPERPVVKDEPRTVAGPVRHEAQARPAAMAEHDEWRAARIARLAGVAEMADERGFIYSEFQDPSKVERMRAALVGELPAADLAASVPQAAEGKALGELFQYVIANPISVGRGQSAMVPIVGARVPCRRELIYNGAKLPNHPVATLRLVNETGLTLEQGPLTVFDTGEYVGEAVLPFTTQGREMVVPYCVELGVKVTESMREEQATQGVRIEGQALLLQSWSVERHTYQLRNLLARDVTVLVEQARRRDYELVEPAEPTEQTDGHNRFAVAVPAGESVELKVVRRCLVGRHQAIRGTSAAELDGFERRSLMDPGQVEHLRALLKFWNRIATIEAGIRADEERIAKLSGEQERIRGNLKSLGTTGREGALRTTLVDRLEAAESELDGLRRHIESEQAVLKGLNAEVERQLEQAAASTATGEA